jgi:hypothetical protein
MRYLYLILLLFLFSSLSLSAQNLKIKVTSLYSNAYNDLFDNTIEHTWRLKYRDVSTNWTYQNVSNGCIAIDSQNRPYINDNVSYVRYLKFGTLPSSFNIGLEGWEDDAGDRCNYDSRDELHEFGFSSTIYLNNLKPGIYNSNPFTSGDYELVTDGGRYKIKYQLYYSFGQPTPTQISISDANCDAIYQNQSYLCADCPIIFNSSINSPNKSNVTYEWQYYGPDDIVTTWEINPAFCGFSPECYDYGYDRPSCCDEPPYREVTTINWNNIPESNTPNYQLDPEKIGLTKNGTYYFRMKVTAGDILMYSEPAEIKLSPSAPKFTILDITNSCPLISNGLINVDILSKPVESVEYGLQAEGKDYAYNGFSSDDPFSINNIKSGNYLLTVKNYGDAGECWSAEAITLGQYDHIAVTDSINQVSCNGANDGEILLTVYGGEPGREIIFESNPTDLPYQRISNTTIRYYGLNPGLYSFTVSDGGCSNQQTIKDIEIIEPDPISATVSATALTCESSANGSINISAVTGGSSLDISKKYNYYLTYNGEIIQSILSTTAISHTFNVPAGAYQVRIEDDNRKHCTDHTQDVVVDDDKLTASYTASDKSCSYNNDGEITVTANKGAGSYVYMLAGTESRENDTGSFTGLSQGIYSVTVKNNNACSDEILFKNIEINGPVPVSFNDPSVSPVGCYGESTGSISVTVSGGTSPYLYQWKYKDGTDIAHENLMSISGLPAGEYYLSITDANNCTANSLIYEITEPPDIALSVDVQHIRCYDENNGKIFINSSGGTGKHIWQYTQGTLWEEFTGSTTFPPGTYQVRVIDENGCIKNHHNDIIITAPSERLSASAIKKDISCHSLSDGSITVTAEGGNDAPFGSTYYYSINNNLFIADDYSHTFINLTAGEYIIRIKDERGCLVTLASVIINEPPPVSHEIAEIVHVECYNASTGEIKIAASGGVGGYEYKLNSGSFQSSSTFSGLKADTYSILVRDTNYCTTSSITATVTQPDAAMEITAMDVQEITCNNGNDGKITATVIGGNENNLLQWQQYINGAWQNISQQNSATLSNRSGGTYRLSISNSAGGSCNIISGPVVLINPDPLAFSSVSIKHVTCKNDADATISPEATGGWGSYKFYYSKDGSNLEFTSSSSFPPGKYTIKVVDDKGCSLIYNEEVIITEPSIPLSADFELSDFNGFNISCNNATDGKITLTASGGNGYPFSNSYTYSLNGSPFAEPNVFSNLSAGSYSIAVKDERGCIFTSIQNITEPERLQLSILNQNEIICHGENTGFIEVVASGGALPYSYSINGSVFKNDPLFSTLEAGNYSLLVKDANGCIETISTTIEGPPAAISHIISRQNITCHNSGDGILSAAISGGWGNYSLDWQKEVNSSWISLPTYDIVVSGLPEGKYRLKITDEKGCSSTSDPVELINPDPLVIYDIAVQQVICKDEGNGKIIPETAGGWGNYQLEYSNGTNTGFTEFNENTAFAPGAYTIRVKDKEACYFVYPEEIIIHEPSQELDFTYTISDYNGFAVSCNNGANGWIEIVPSGGNGGSFSDKYTFSLNNNAFTDNLLNTGLAAGNYTLTVRDQRGCEISKNALLSQPAELKASLARKNYIKCYGDSTGFIEIGVSGGTTPYTYQINDAGLQAEPHFQNLATGDYHLTVEDANGCTDEFYETIIQPFDSLTVDFSIANISCFEGADGEITANVHGGNAPYSYSWKNLADSVPSLKELPSGKYSIRISDNEGCEIIDSVNLTQPGAPLIAEINPDVLHCFGDANGTIKVEASGGTAPYQYSFDGGSSFQDDQLKTALNAGNYEVQVKDINGCLYNENTDVLQPDSLELHLNSLTEVLCHGDSSGAISLTANGGIGGFSFRLNQQGFDTAGQFLQLSAGDYIAEVRDKNECSRILEVTIQQPAPLTIDLAIAPVLCKGDQNGAVVIAPGGGVGEYYVFIDEVEVATDTMKQLFAGDYKLQLSDEHECRMDTSFTIIEPERAFDLTLASKKDISCFGLADGEIHLEALGGYGAYSIALDDLAEDSVYSFKNLSAKQYLIAATDSLGCRDSINIELFQPELLQLSVAESRNVLCNSDSTGYVELSSTGGNGGFNFTYNSTSQPDSLITDLTAAEYEFFIEDKKGCKDSISHFISEPDPIAAKINDVVNAACGQSNGEAKITVEGGIPQYRIEWMDLNNESVHIGDYSQTLFAGKYNIFITDSHACELQLSHTVIDNGAPELQLVNSVPVSCFDGSNGSAEVSATGGAGDYTFSWSDSLRQSTPAAQELKSGVYSVSVKDARGCMTLLDVIVDTPLPVSVKLQQTVEPTCNGFDDGELFISASGGTESYSFIWPAGTTYTEGHAFDLMAGEYTVIAEDSNGCTGHSDFVLSEPEKLIADSATVITPSCDGRCDGKIELHPAGGTGAYKIIWNDSTAYGPTISALCDGNYEAVVTDVNGCTDAEVFTVVSPAPLQLSIEDIVGTTCSYTEDGIVKLNSQGGTFPYKYNWLELTNFTAASNESLAPGEYTVTLKDANGCADSLVATVPKPDTIDINVIERKEPLCFGDCNGSLKVEAYGGAGVFNYEWNNEEKTPFINNICSGEYNVVVIDEKNCVGEFDITLGQPPPLDIELDVISHVSCYGDNNGAITIVASGGKGFLHYLWKGLEIDSTFVQNLYKGEYEVVLSDDNGCRDSSTYLIKEPLPITAKIINIEIPSCKENCDGKLTIQAEGGNGQYNYVWPEIEQEGLEALDLCEGDYRVIITDSFACKVDTSFYLRAPPQLAVELLTKVEPECSEDCTGEIELFAYGGTAPYNYHWIDHEEITANGANRLCADIYRIEVTDFNNCFEEKKIILSGPDVMQVIVAERTAPSCAEASDGALEVRATGGTAPYQYEWISQQQMGQRIGDIPQGNYPVKIMDAAGCVYIEEIHLSAPSPLQIELIETASPTCSYNCDGWAEIIPFGGTAPYTVQWNDPENQKTLKAENLCPGTYEVKIIDKNGCTSAMVVEVNETPPIAIDLGKSRTLCKDQEALLDPGIADLTYRWTSDNGFKSDEQQVALNQAGSYYLQATNASGCIARDTFQVFTTEEEFEVNFLAASQLIVGDTVLLTEVCYPVADHLEWHFEESVDIIDPNDFQPRISYTKAGTYPVTLTGYYGKCYEAITKHITFYNPGEAPDLNGRIILGESGIKNVQLHPNPTDGEINLAVTMHREAPLAVFIYDNFGQELYRVSRESAIFYRFFFDISNERIGTYHVKLVSNNNMKSLKVIKSK